MRDAPSKYFSRVKRYILSDGERFATVVDDAGVPAYYPTALALSRRSRGVSADTLAAIAGDLVQIGLWAEREGIDLNGRLENGAYFGSVEVETLASACGITTAALRRLASRQVSEIRHGASVTKANLVINSLKRRRLETAAAYFNLVGLTSEAKLPKRSQDRDDRIAGRMTMVEMIKSHRPKMKSSRVRGAVKADQLARVAAFVVTGSPFSIWADEAIARRNWALITTLITTGIRQGEARQLKPADVDLAVCELRVERRHDDNEDPRKREPNAKTYDRIIPIDPCVAAVLEDYMLGAGSDAAERRGSAFLFLSHDNRTCGTPLSDRAVQRIVRDLGRHLQIKGLTPHQLRHGWIQNLARWGLAVDITSEDFDRFANYLGGWSYVRKMASEYRADQLTAAAFAAGFKVEESRS